MLQLSTIKLCAKVHGQWTCNDNVLNDLFRTTVTHGHFDMGYSESTFSKYAFVRGGGGHKKEYAVYARENDDNYGRPLTHVVNYLIHCIIFIYYFHILNCTVIFCLYYNYMGRIKIILILIL